MMTLPSRVAAVLAVGAAVAAPGLFGAHRASADRELVARVPGLSGHVAGWQKGKASGPISGVPVRNFGVVDPGCLYRSAQPGDDADYEWLVNQGFKGIVCLRAEDDCSDRQKRLEARGVSYLHLSVPNEHAPSDEQARAFLAFVTDPKHWPVLVHCKDGIGRASTMIALVRYAVDGWSMTDALREAKNYRPFHFRMFGEQRRWLNHWRDRFPAGEVLSAKVTTAAGTVPAAN